MGGKVSYYCGHYGLKANIVLHPDDRRYAPIECELGNWDIEGAAYYKPYAIRLIRQKNEMEKPIPLREPDLLTTLTGGEFAYTRENG